MLGSTGVVEHAEAEFIEIFDEASLPLVGENGMPDSPQNAKGSGPHEGRSLPGALGSGQHRHRAIPFYPLN